MASDQHARPDLRWIRGRSIPLIDQPADAGYSRKVRLREESAWQRYGPVRYRLVKLLRLLLVLAAAYASTLVLSTLVAFYPGTGSVGAQGATERGVRVTVESCERTGPLHGQRLGWWWDCQVQVPGAGRALVGRSILSEDDIGTTVELQQACYPDHCTLGRETGAGWQLYAGALRILGWALLAGLLVWAATYLLAAVVGGPRFADVMDWWQRTMVKGRR